MITGWQTAERWEVGRKCLWGQSSVVNAALTLSVCPLTNPLPPHPPTSAPRLEFKQLFCFVEMASGCLFSFLSFYFLPFFSSPRHLKLQRLKGTADGRSNRHSAAPWTLAASRAADHWERGGLGCGWNIGCVFFCEGLEGRGGVCLCVCILKSAYEYKKGMGLAKNVGRPYGHNKSCIPVFCSFLQ